MHAYTGPIVVMQKRIVSWSTCNRLFDDTFSQVPSAEVVVLGGFNAHSASWLGSRTTAHEGKRLHSTLLWRMDCPNRLSRLLAMRPPDVDNHNTSLFDLLLVSHPEQYQVIVDDFLVFRLLRSTTGTEYRAH